jgi:hypothetical protein
MSRKLKCFPIRYTDHPHHNYRNNQEKKSLCIENNNNFSSNFNRTITLDNNHNKRRRIFGSQNFNSPKSSEPKKEEIPSASNFSPNSNIKISYLRQYNNNSIYYSNHKRSNGFSMFIKTNYLNNYLNTEPKVAQQKQNLKYLKDERKKNNSHSAYFGKVFDLKKNTKLSIDNYNRRRNIIENSKNSNEDKNLSIFSKDIFWIRNKGLKIKLPPNKTLEKSNMTKKNYLSYIISSKKFLGIQKTQNQYLNLKNPSKVNKINNYLNIKISPEIINPNEYIKINQIGHGSFGEIFKVKWNKNNKNYAMKEMHFSTEDNIIYLKERVKFIIELVKKTKCDGLIKIFGDYSAKKENEYYYYEIMELADNDWEQEIKIRSQKKKYYSEKELFNIMTNLIKTLSLLQKNHITHRDIKLQNILLVNNKYKIGDFGESRTLNQKGVIAQPVRGSELFMSPILFFGLNLKIKQVIHNTYKSDVFSLGMCALYAANLSDNILYDIRELTNMDNIKKIIYCYLHKRYSRNFIQLLLCMLEIDEKKRPDFIMLEKLIFEYK